VTGEAVVTDLDGTIVRADETISEATIAACRTLRTRGIPVIAATARSPAGLRALRDLTPHLTLGVCCGGSIGYAPGSETVRWRETLQADAVRTLLSLIRAELPDAGFAAYDGESWRMTPAYAAIRTSQHKGPVAVVPADEFELSDAAACAMTLCHPELPPAKVIELLTARGIGLTFSYAGPELVEVGPAGVDKASGVLRALREVGVPTEHAVAFGDMPIDIPMFTVVGTSVAMADAPPEVLAAATTVTATVEEDGFAHALNRLGLI
jgi:Cof subfamily protein (haloacid dehalogenase superfamily)